MTLRELAARLREPVMTRKDDAVAQAIETIADEFDKLRADLAAVARPAQQPDPTQHPNPLCPFAELECLCPEHTCECGKPITRPGALYCSGTCAQSGPSGMIKRGPSRQCIATKGHDGGHLFAATDCVANPEERGERCPATQESARESEPPGGRRDAIDLQESGWDPASGGAYTKELWANCERNAKCMEALLRGYQDTPPAITEAVRAEVVSLLRREPPEKLECDDEALLDWHCRQLARALALLERSA